MKAKFYNYSTNEYVTYYSEETIKQIREYLEEQNLKYDTTACEILEMLENVK